MEQSMNKTQTSLGSLSFCREFSRDTNPSSGVWTTGTQSSQGSKAKKRQSQVLSRCYASCFIGDFLGDYPVRVQLWFSKNTPVPNPAIPNFNRQALINLPQLGFIWCRPPRLSCHHPRSGKTRPPRLSWRATGRVTAREYLPRWCSRETHSTASSLYVAVLYCEVWNLNKGIDNDLAQTNIHLEKHVPKASKNRADSQTHVTTRPQSPTIIKHRRCCEIQLGM